MPPLSYAVLITHRLNNPLILAVIPYETVADRGARDGLSGILAPQVGIGQEYTRLLRRGVVWGILIILQPLRIFSSRVRIFSPILTLWERLPKPILTYSRINILIILKNTLTLKCPCLRRM